MKFEIYHKGFRLAKCKTAEGAFKKAQLYQEWFSGVEIRKVG